MNEPHGPGTGAERHIGLIVALCLIVYGQTLSFGFVTYDDPAYSYDNEHIRGGLSAEGLRWALSRDTMLTHSNWIPLTFLSLMLDADLYGDWAGGYHLTNLGLHLANSILLYLLLCRMTDCRSRSAVVACIFAVHPLHVESVAWVTERKDVLSTFFGLLAMLGYVRWIQTGRLWNYSFALLSFLLSLLAKQTLVTLPFLLLLLDFWPLGRLGAAAAPTSPPGLDWAVLRRRIVEKLPFLALSILFSAAVYRAQQYAMPDAFGLRTRIANAGIAIVMYVWRTVWPVGLSVFYPHPGNGISLPVAGVCWALVILISIICAWQLRRRPWLAVGWFWFLGTLVPMLGLVQVGEQQMADRYMYVPQTGLVLAAVWMIAGLARAHNWPARRLTWLAASFLTALTCAAVLQTRLWRDSEALYMHSLAQTRNNATVEHLMATLLAERGQWRAAEEHYRRAVELDPRNPTLAANHGALLARAGRLDAARRELQRAIELQPNHANARIDLARVEELNGNLDAAVEHIRVARSLNPDSPELDVILARVLMLQGHFAMAEEILRRSVAQHADQALSWTYLGFVLLETDRRDDAAECFETALRIDPGEELARTGLSQTWE